MMDPREFFKLMLVFCSTVSGQVMPGSAELSTRVLNYSNFRILAKTQLSRGSEQPPAFAIFLCSD